VLSNLQSNKVFENLLCFRKAIAASVLLFVVETIPPFITHIIRVMIGDCLAQLKSSLSCIP